MNALAMAAIKAGLIDKDMLEEFRRWKAPIDIPEELPEPPKTIEEAAAAIEEALQGEGLVVTRETDLEILQQYLTKQRVGKLHVEVPKEAGHEFITTEADFDIVYSSSLTGEYIIPWQGDNIRSEMTNGLTYLLIDDEKVFFKDIREVFYGDTKAFMVCTPSIREKLNG